ncbi:hypothetical protein ACFQ9H_11135 [Streptomyces sp. NPDC056517]|uniref:hypothetical protein n=1 Tax=Streptomyces sp. NPDC056517 TaxID=3345848 RepID=UPI0036953E5A
MAAYDSVSMTDWSLKSEDGGAVPLPSSIPDWDFQSDLTLETVLNVDLDAVRASTALPPESELILTVVWSASGSGVRRLADQVPMHGTGSRSAQLTFVVAGRDSGGTLSVETQLVLAKSIENPDPTGPQRAGSILWRHDVRVRLQGDASQFPMAVVDFKATGYPENAPWYLDISPNLEAATMGAVVLLVNDNTPVVLNALRKADKASYSERLIQSALRQDVLRLMVERAVSDDELEEHSVFEPDTLGHMLLGLIRTYLPGTTLTSLRTMRQSDPALLSARVQHAVGLFQRES